MSTKLELVVAVVVHRRDTTWQGDGRQFAHPPKMCRIKVFVLDREVAVLMVELIVVVVEVEIEIEIVVVEIAILVPILVALVVVGIPAAATEGFVLIVVAVDTAESLIAAITLDSIAHVQGSQEGRLVVFRSALNIVVVVEAAIELGPAFVGTEFEVKVERCVVAVVVLNKIQLLA